MSAGPPDIDDAMEELVELEDMVDSRAEREQVREAMRTLEEARRPRLFGRLREGFGFRDAAEAVLGSLIVGVPIIFEDGTFDVGAHLAATPLALLGTTVVGLGIVLAILRAVAFSQVEEDLLFGLVPVRLVGILSIAALTSVLTLTAWGRVDWATPRTAAGQTLLVALLMAIGASLGDILPESSRVG